MRFLTLVLILLSTSVATAQQYRHGSHHGDRTTMPKFKIVPPDEAKRLDILKIPTTKPIPLIIGHYWNCSNQGGSGPLGEQPEFEICDFVLVVCTDDQSFCVHN